MSISRKILIYFILMASFSLISFLNLTRIINDVKMVEEVQDQRYEFHRLVNDYKDNVSSFTHIFNVYTHSNDKEYKRRLEQYLPDDFNNENIKEYRSLILQEFNFQGNTQNTRSKREQSVEFLDKIDFSKDYFKKYFYADKLSLRLLEMQFEAINASRGIYKDKNGLYTIKKEPSMHLTQSLLSNESYLELHRDIDRNIHKLFLDVDKAFVVYIKELEDDEREAYVIAMLLSGLLLVFVMFFYLLFKDEIVNPLNELTLWIRQMKKNEYTIKDSSFRKDEIGTIMNSFNNMANKIQNNIKDLEHLSTTDTLTKLYNRNFLEKSLKQAFYNKNRYKNECTLIVLDIDHFKAVNDTYGHLVGDSVLKEFASILSSNIRLTDILGRWGGEEFLIICNNTDLDGAKIIANKLRQEVEKHEFETVGKKTASFGLACFNDTSSIDEVIQRADDALYDAKKAGRNIVVCR